MLVAELLDAAKEKTGSDRQTAVKLGIPASFMSRIRSGKATLPTPKVFYLADILGLPYLRLLCEVEAEQTNNAKDREMLKKVAQDMALSDIKF